MSFLSVYSFARMSFSVFVYLYVCYMYTSTCVAMLPKFFLLLASTAQD